ncbi:MAG: hypothetical protein CME98_16445 [Hyphomonas sp.]|jgi:hypothetical protein|nr:hypothetical protein [Hyphomonas sp.]|tara:strand:- start:514 stop:1062 length:549 start_codon:yes stop_codon:yes gene_type:complete
MPTNDNNLDNFIDQFNGGNRTHRYEIEMEFPRSISGGAEEMNKFFIRAVSLPPSQVNPIRIPYRGRILKWPGDRIYFPWTFRVLDQNNGVNKSLWNNFNAWSNVLNDHKSNIASQKWDDFTQDWVIKQVDNDGDDIKKTKLVGCWPTIVGPISMDANSIDTLVEFTVTVEYAYHLVDGINQF